MGDCNCFFRAISFLITGCDSSHNKIHVHLVAYTVEEVNWDCLKQYVPTKYKSGVQYANDIKMAFFGEWVMEVELFTGAQFMGWDVIVYTPHEWLCYK